MKRWYERPMRVLDLAQEDPYGQWIDRWTARDLVATAMEIDANVIDIMIVNEWGQAYFAASQLPRHPQLAGRDQLAEVLREAKEHDLRVTGMWGPSPNPILYECHPDWAKRSIDGQTRSWGYPHMDPCVHVCHNSPYGDIVLETLEELFAGYRIDGVAFDYFDQRPCYCRFCRDRWLRESRLDLEQQASWTEAELRRFAEWSKGDALGFMSRAVKVARQHDRIIVGWADTSDVIFSEPHTGGMITLVDKGFEIRRVAARARIQGKPTVLCTPYAHLYYVGMSKPPAQMRQEFREIVVAGSSLWPVIWDWEMVKDRRGLDALGTVFREVRDREQYLADATTLKHTALLVSDHTLSLFSDAPYRHLDPVKGWYDALVRAHIPVDLVLDEELAPDVLSGYRALILANAACLSDRQIGAIAEFVSRGGGLVATHETSLYDGDGFHRRGLGLREVLGCEFQAVIDDAWTYISLQGGHTVTEGFDDGFLLLHGEMRSLDGRLNPEQRSRAELALRGITADAWRQLKVAPLGSSQVIGHIFDSARPLGTYFVKDLAPAMPGKDTGYPGIIANRFGEGRVIYFPGQPDRLFYRIGHPDYERLLVNALEYAGGAPAASVRAPTTVEVAFYQQPGQGRWIIHLLNHSYDQLYPAPATGQYGQFSREVCRVIGDVIPVSGIDFILTTDGGAPPGRVFCLASGHDLQISQSAGSAQFVLPSLAEYEVVVVEFAGQDR